jgi:uncharacterized protein
MSREFPDFVDPWRAAEGGRRIGGTIPLSRMKRLAPMLASDAGEVEFELIFRFDAQRRPGVVVEVAAPLKLMCQRSLEPYTEQVRQRSELQIIGSPEEQALLADDEEFVVTESGRLSVADIVEDELLLAVPQIPRNPDVGSVWSTSAEDSASGGQNGAGESRRSVRNEGESGREDRQRPFEALAEMMKNK